MIDLNNEEIEFVSGGKGWGAVALAITIYDAASDFCKGFADGFNSNA